MFLLAAAFGVLAPAATSAVRYAQDPAWEPAFPVGAHTFSAVGIHQGTLFVTQRGNSSLDPVVLINKHTGHLVQTWGARDVAVALPAGTWGAHGLAVEACGFSCVTDPLASDARIWIEDFTNHTVTAFSATGAKLLQLGTPGLAGNGTAPIQFGNVADAVIVPGSAAGEPSQVYATDGDGGSANRVVKVEVPADAKHSKQQAPTVVWATGHVFDNPHSITLHAKSQLLVVADREHSTLKLIDARDGTVLGPWNCTLTFGDDQAAGVPFGVRTLEYDGDDLLFVASMDNPQDHKHQQISVLDVSGLTADAGVGSPCRVLQTIPIAPASEYSGPHLLGVDHSNGDVYAALVADAPRSTVLRFSRE